MEKTYQQKIIEVLTKNKQGLTMNKIAKFLNITPYKLNSEIYVLLNQKKITITVVGASKLVRLQ